MVNEHEDEHEEERFAIVNLSDVPIHFVTGKAALHNQPEGNYHRAVHVFFDITRGRFMLQLKGPDTENAGKWSSAVSGHVRAGENYKDAAVRETKEELGLNIDPEDLEYVGTLQPCKETGWEFVKLYTYLMDDNKEYPNPNWAGPQAEVLELRINKLTEVVTDVAKHPTKYSPPFILLFSMWQDTISKKELYT